MATFPKISIITPSLNSSRYLEDAIRSVLLQNYTDFEHIVVDGGSQDSTLAILRKYPHLVWISEPDKGQSDAMNKGFAMSSGRIIVYLNADDVFEPDAFRAVLPCFEQGEKFVVGIVRVLMANGQYYLNAGKATFEEMLKWWESDAFCYNSLGYFYRRDVQEQIGFNVDNHQTMDVEFLLNVSRKFRLTRINRILGTFRYFPDTKTFRRRDIVCQVRDLAYLDDYLQFCSEGYAERYLTEKRIHVERMMQGRQGAAP